ncbi:MAG: aminodeoxychorismate/anthranilate synthase component II [Deltaproteobacteria bacterium]|jgi:anthranilate synthase/aminodeoxychorismate synthase-like glutamine amidotransferase|uniref:Aminodeoxychorismate/anthranilate synthase component II n=1 Tax=Candidatus Acidulodesulfobacterium acidiphilum TaxID=2597224 RepID=A0A520XCT4_9DELT|nr:aminodeoxychorismate/anthranilate synthase component II [Deltaproteobacteria bacterium]MCL6120054.1 aminodeoxychorismate/anthranilate synthase component II [Deltaproteobacteria bacterium]MDA8299902.1 aminodeoxychorismate/anthranilate synthase component II [Deltaproteobacteria bacterium]RZV38966.1 MAG: aminodeoxychorismate/anthranilate synthase component II [Candidatus Acidulodesulfobacterium acidiphilum]
MILIIDNYDSFTYNIVQYIGELNYDTVVYRNDAIDVSDIAKMKPEKIVISPGPKSPQYAGITVDVIKSFYKEIPILGICLGHQAIGYAFGGEIIRAANIMHGKVSAIEHDSSIIYGGIPSPFEATRYHSLVINKEKVPEAIKVTAISLGDNEIMGIEVKGYKVFGVQFHPESILTSHGKQLINNFLSV